MVVDKRPDIAQAATMTALPSGIAGAVNMFANPFAAVAAASALGIGVTSRMFGFWMGTFAGVAEASQSMFMPLDAKAGTGTRSASTRAKSATRVLIEETQSAALEIAGEAEKPEVAPTAKKTAALQPEDFRQPKSLAKPRKVDDLKAISGIGPKLEKVLNELGVWSYAQIAAWTPEEIGWVDDYLSFKGRIERDGWIGQASALSGKKR